LGDQSGLPLGHGREQRDISVWPGKVRVMTLDHVVGKLPRRLDVAARREILERADPHVA